MDMQTLEERIGKRADQSAQEKIRDFKVTMRNALADLVGSPRSGYNDSSDWIKLHDHTTDAVKSARRCLEVMLSGDDRKGWPSVIWDREREETRGAVLQTMDAMAKMLAAPEPDPDGNKSGE